MFPSSDAVDNKSERKLISAASIANFDPDLSINDVS